MIHNNFDSFWTKFGIVSFYRIWHFETVGANLAFLIFWTWQPWSGTERASVATLKFEENAIYLMDKKLTFLFIVSSSSPEFLNVSLDGWIQFLVTFKIYNLSYILPSIIPSTLYVPRNGIILQPFLLTLKRKLYYLLHQLCWIIYCSRYDNSAKLISSILETYKLKHFTINKSVCIWLSYQSDRLRKGHLISLNLAINIWVTVWVSWLKESSFCYMLWIVK